MNTCLRILFRLQRWSISLYPFGFREAFGDEMPWVFESTARERARAGWGALARFILREVAGWGETVAREHVETVLRRFIRSKADRTTPRNRPFAQNPARSAIMAEGSRRSGTTAEGGDSGAIIAALPPLLFGVGIAATSLVRGGPWYTVPAWRLYFSVAIGFIPMGVIGVGAGLALVRRVPNWGWSWIGAGLIGAALLVQSFVSEAEDIGRALPGWAETSLTLLFMAAGAGLLIAAAMRGIRWAGLFSMTAAGTFGLSMYLAMIAGPFFRHDLAPLAAPLGLLFSGMVYAYVRTTGISSILPIIVMGVLNLASFMLANIVWSDWLSAQSKPSPVVPLIILGTALLLSGPTMGWLVRPFRNALGRAA